MKQPHGDMFSYSVSAKDRKRLDSVMNEVRQAFKAPPIEAKVVQYQRYHSFARSGPSQRLGKNKTLQIEVGPLMLRSLSRSALRLIIAHEMVHLERHGTPSVHLALKLAAACLAVLVLAVVLSVLGYWFVAVPVILIAGLLSALKWFSLNRKHELDADRRAVFLFPDGALAAWDEFMDLVEEEAEAVYERRYPNTAGRRPPKPAYSGRFASYPSPVVRREWIVRALAEVEARKKRNEG